MAKQAISLGTAPSGAGGDTNRSGFTKANSNFNELYAFLGGDNLPAAKIIESGSNANGTYTKHADGSMICRHGIAVQALAPGNAVAVGWTYPAGFITQPTIVPAGGSVSGNGGFLNVAMDNSPSGSSAGFAIANMHPSATLANPYIHVIAVGRWF